MTRIDGRKQDELRPVEIIPNINKFAEGSCLIRCGNTHVLCTASVEDRLPRHVPEGSWSPPSTHAPGPTGSIPAGEHLQAEAQRPPAEIQRLIGRALRSVVDMKRLGPWNITIDCDVLQGDGGTRTASITGGSVAMMLAFRKMMEAGQLAEYPISGYVAAAVSAGIVDDVPLLDLCYEEDSAAMVDLNCVMDDQGRLIEIQGTGEERPFTLTSSGSWWSCARRVSGGFRRSRKRSWAYKQRRNNMKLVLASKNKKKLVEMNEILSHLGTEVCSEAEAGVDVEVEETGTTFEENSLLKARAVMEASGLPPLPTTPACAWTR